jgi:predicted RNA binding protein YcfA (HicA-like mRNA interferase family)
MKARELRRLLSRQPLAYGTHRQTGGSHTKLVSENGYLDLLFAFHDNQSIPPGLVKEILTKRVGLSDEEATALL